MRAAKTRDVVNTRCRLEAALDGITEERDGIAIISPRGDIDAITAPELQREFDRLLAQAMRYFVLDLSKVGFIDSAGLAALINLCKRVRVGEGDVRLAAIPFQVLPVFKITRLDRVFEIFETSADAARSLAGRA
jgi:anti-sigma B factor antagonist